MNIKTLAFNRLPGIIRGDWFFATTQTPFYLWIDAHGFDQVCISQECQLRNILKIKPINVSGGVRYKVMRGNFYKLSENNFELRYKRLKELAKQIRAENWNFAFIKVENNSRLE